MRLILLATAAILSTAGFAQAQADPVETCLFEEEDFAATLAACNAALLASDNPTEQGRYILHRGLAHEGLGDFQSALLDQILVGEYRPDWFRGYANASSLAFELGDEEGERRWAEAAMEAEPENPRAYVSVLVITSNSDVEGECEPVADQILGLMRDPIDWPFDIGADPYLLGNLGFCLNGLDRNEEALAAYRAAQYTGLDAHWFFYDFARLAYFDLEDDARAVELATRALGFEDADPGSAHILVNANVYLGALDEALAAERNYTAMIDDDDNIFGTRNHVAWRLFLVGRLDEAAEVMSRWQAALDPNDQYSDQDIANAWDTVAHIRAATGDADGALAAFANSLAREESDVLAVRRETYRDQLELLGIAVPDGEDGLMAGLAACSDMGAACRLFFEDDAAAQEVLNAETTE